jgi:general secretion pathway protein K
MLAAIVGIAAFSYVSFETLAENRGIISEVQAEAERARLSAACDAGIAEAIAGIANPDRSQQWAIDGRTRNVLFDGIPLAIVIEDERGKIPLNGINEDQARDMFSIAGASGARLDTLTDSFEDWQDPDNIRRPNGAEAAEYLSQGYKPRNGAFHSTDELRMLNGMDDALFARISSSITVFFGESGGFAESTATPFALEVIGEAKPNSEEVIRRERQIAGEVPPTMIPNVLTLVGRTLTVRVEAKLNGADVKRAAIVELTNNKADPYWLRYLY